DALAHETASVPQEQVLGGLLADRAGAAQAFALISIAGRRVDRFEIETVMKRKFLIFRGHHRQRRDRRNVRPRHPAIAQVEIVFTTQRGADAALEHEGAGDGRDEAQQQHRQPRDQEQDQQCDQRAAQPAAPARTTLHNHHALAFSQVSAGCARANRKPCPHSQPSLRSTSRCASVSMPSAITCMVRVSASARIARTTATLPPLSPAARRATKDWSIFKACSGYLCRYESEE